MVIFNSKLLVCQRVISHPAAPPQRWRAHHRPSSAPCGSLCARCEYGEQPPPHLRFLAELEPKGQNMQWFFASIGIFRKHYYCYMDVWFQTFSAKRIQNGHFSGDPSTSYARNRHQEKKNFHLRGPWDWFCLRSTWRKNKLAISYMDHEWIRWISDF